MLLVAFLTSPDLVDTGLVLSSPSILSAFSFDVLFTAASSVSLLGVEILRCAFEGALLVDNEGAVGANGILVFLSSSSIFSSFFFFFFLLLVSFALFSSCL